MAGQTVSVNGVVHLTQGQQVWLRVTSGITLRSTPPFSAASWSLRTSECGGWSLLTSQCGGWSLLTSQYGGLSVLTSECGGWSLLTSQYGGWSVLTSQCVEGQFWWLISSDH